MGNAGPGCQGRPGPSNTSMSHGARGGCRRLRRDDVSSPPLRLDSLATWPRMMAGGSRARNLGENDGFPSLTAHPARGSPGVGPSHGPSARTPSSELITDPYLINPSSGLIKMQRGGGPTPARRGGRNTGTGSDYPHFRFSRPVSRHYARRGRANSHITKGVAPLQAAAAAASLMAAQQGVRRQQSTGAIKSQVPATCRAPQCGWGRLHWDWVDRGHSLKSALSRRVRGSAPGAPPRHGTSPAPLLRGTGDVRLS